MRTIAVLSFIILPFFCFSQNNNPNYDAQLAKELGADDHGMKSYVFVILKTGPAKIKDKAVLDSCYAGHFANIHRLEEVGKMVVAGPYGENKDHFRGLFILDVPTIEEAEKLLANDPSISLGVFEAGLYEWYGPAALPVYSEAADKVWKIKP